MALLMSSNIKNEYYYINIILSLFIIFIIVSFKKFYFLVRKIVSEVTIHSTLCANCSNVLLCANNHD